MNNNPTVFSFLPCKSMPSVAEARRWNRICRAEGGTGFREINREPGTHPKVNNGEYFGWFTGPNGTADENTNLSARVAARIDTE